MSSPGAGPITPALAAAIATALDAGQPSLGEGPTAALVVAELGTGTRVAIDRTGGWHVALDGGDRVAFGPGTEGRFVELLEESRRDFDDRLEASARAAALPVDDLLVAFPAVPLLRAVLALSSGYTARLALRWLLPSERAELMPAITALVKNGDMPQDVRDLARHLAR